VEFKEWFQGLKVDGSALLELFVERGHAVLVRSAPVMALLRRAAITRRLRTVVCRARWSCS